MGFSRCGSAWEGQDNRTTMGKRMAEIVSCMVMSGIGAAAQVTESGTSSTVPVFTSTGSPLRAGTRPSRLPAVTPGWNERIGDHEQICVHLSWFGFGIGVRGCGADGDWKRHLRHGSCLYRTFHHWEFTNSA